MNDPDDISAHFMIRGKATVDRTDDLLGIMSEVLLEVSTAATDIEFGHAYGHS